jgi:AcrR family transcriptional regulator
MKRSSGGDAKDDLRIRRTRKFLSDALFQLMEETPFDSISVIDICERAMVHRTTFYAHFEDKNHLFRYAVSELQKTFDRLSSIQTVCTDIRGLILEIFESALGYMRDHSTLYQTGVGKSGALVIEMFSEMLVDDIRNKLEEREKQGFSLAVPSVIAAQFYTGAIVGVGKWWLDDGLTTDIGQMRGYMEKLIGIGRPGQPEPSHTKRF